MEPIADTEIKRVLVINAHPDDSDFGASGTIAQWVKKGIEVAYVFCTNGDQGGEESGFTKEDAIIDLSGQSPGLLYLLGAKSIGTAWNIGGYKGSLDMAKATFNLVDCTDIANAWVLYESKGSRSISTDLLTSLGMNFPMQYQKIGSWETPSGAGGYKEIRTQEVYKPLNVNIAKASCELTRKKTLR